MKRKIYQLHYWLKKNQVRLWFFSFVMMSMSVLLQSTSGQQGLRSPTYVAQLQRPAASGTACDSVNDASVAAYWRMDESSGNETDTKNGNVLVDNNTVTSAAGKISTSRQFTAANTEYFSIADNASISLGADTAFTITCFVYSDADLSAVTKAVVTKSSSSVAADIEFNLVCGVASIFTQFTVGNGTTSQDVFHAAVPAQSAWTFICVQHDPDANILSVSFNDGTPTTAAWSGGTKDTTAAMNIGRDVSGLTGASTWDGRIEEFLYTKRLLSAGEITALYNSGNACRPTGL